MQQIEEDPSRERAIRLTREELREVVNQAVEETFIRMGVDASDPIEMQKDFQYLRDWRTTTEAVKRKSLLTIVGIIVVGMTALIWISITGRN